MRFKGLDLNLLVAFDTLMATRSVSRSAEQLNLSQPAMSAALGRLRDYFGDMLLVQQGKRMFPTAYAESLMPMVHDSLRRIEEMIATSTAFDPATSQRPFLIIASDYIGAAVIAPLARTLAQIAPGVRLEMILPGAESGEMIRQGKVDMQITPENFLASDHPAELLFEERHVVVGWKDNPLFARGIDEAALMAAGHVGVVIGNERTLAFADREMERTGRSRRLEITTSSFSMVPWLLIDTMRLALMHERLAHRMATMFPIAIAPIPFPFAAMRQMMQYNQARAADEGLRWLRDAVRGAATAPNPS